MDTQYNVPTLFVIFKRKDTALQSFAQIRKIRPAKLYIAGDGPRENVEGEAEAVADVRRTITESIDWDCDVKTLWREKNIGCCQGVYTAINWLFENEERGIIIEDDCVMRLSFFRFAEEMLEKYADDERVGIIDGANYTGIKIPYSYGFSRFKSTHGWATWRRAWKNMDLDMKWRGGDFEKSVIANSGYHGKDKKFWRYCLKTIDEHDVSAWDWQWYFALASQNQLSIYPCVNLTSNIGFGISATHTTAHNIPKRFISKDGEIEFPLRHPPYVVPYEAFERKFYKQTVTPFERIKELFPIKFKQAVRKIVRGK